MQLTKKDDEIFHLICAGSFDGVSRAMLLLAKKRVKHFLTQYAYVSEVHRQTNLDKRIYIIE